jgi:hypothetical protein
LRIRIHSNTVKEKKSSCVFGVDDRFFSVEMEEEELVGTVSESRDVEP